MRRRDHFQEESQMLIDASSFFADDVQTYAEPAGTPSAEALSAMRVAGDVARQLHEAGRELRFALAPSPARVEVLLCDIDGPVISRLSPTHALEIMSGAAFMGGIA
jgi:hypothetical protein